MLAFNTVNYKSSYTEYRIHMTSKPQILFINPINTQMFVVLIVHKQNKTKKKKKKN